MSEEYEKLISIFTKKSEESKNAIDLIDGIDDRLRIIETEKIPNINEKISSINTTIKVVGGISGVIIGAIGTIMVVLIRGFYSDISELLKIVYQHIGNSK